MILVVFAGAPVGGQAAGLLVANFGWRAIFASGALLSLLLLPVMLVWLPESPRILARKSNLWSRQGALIARLGIAPGQADLHRDEICSENPIKIWFGHGYKLHAVLPGVLFFCFLLFLLILYIVWTFEIFDLAKALSPSPS